MTSCMLIVNPSSGKGLSSDVAKRFEDKLHEQYDSVCVKYTEKAGDATAFASHAADERMEAVFAIGGDGTVSECVNGLVGKSVLPDFGFLPGGTINNLSKQLNIPQDLETAIDEFSFLHKTCIDLGTVNGRSFISSVSVGVLPDSLKEASAEEKTESGTLAYLKKGMDALFRDEKMSFKLTIDAEEITLDSTSILVSLAGSIAGITHALPDATLSDGYLHVVVLKGSSLLKQWTTLPNLVVGNLEEDNHVFYRKAHRLRIEQRTGKPLNSSNLDGDEGPSLPLELTVLKEYLTVFVPGDTN